MHSCKVEGNYVFVLFFIFHFYNTNAHGCGLHLYFILLNKTHRNQELINTAESMFLLYTDKYS